MSGNSKSQFEPGELSNSREYGWLHSILILYIMLITGGDSGIERAIGILYALEGADSAIVYTAQEEKDAQDTKALLEKKGKT